MRRLIALLVAAVTTVVGCSGDAGDGGGTTQPTVFTTLAVAPASVGLFVGGTQTLTVTAIDQDNNAASGLTVTYASSDQTKATVTNGGVVTGVGAGTAVITVTGTVGSVTRTKDVTATVTQPVVFTTLAVTPPSAVLSIGGSVTLTATALDQNGSPMSGLSVTYVSGDQSKATVDNIGKVTGVAAGTVFITATGTVGSVTKTGSFTLTVTQPAAVFTTMTVTPTTATVVVGATQALTASARDQNGATMSGLATTFTSGNNAIATVNTSGVITGVAQGSTTIAVNGTVGTVTKTQSVPVNVTMPSGSASVAATASNQFTPTTVTVTRNGTVTWSFAALHNVTFDTQGAPAGIGTRDSGTASITFPASGTFAYHCTIHGAGMSGTVVVQ